MSSKKKNLQKKKPEEKKEIVSDNSEKKNPEKIDSNKKSKYTMNDFINDVNSDKPNNVKATVKGVTTGLKTFVSLSPHPMTKFIRETMQEIFS